MVVWLPVCKKGNTALEAIPLGHGDGRCRVTHNARNYVPLTGMFAERQWPHAGLLIVARSLPNLACAGIARALTACAREHGEDLPAYTVLFPSADTND